jgi:OOP family OmpA-OmpF porin
MTPPQRAEPDGREACKARIAEAIGADAIHFRQASADLDTVGTATLDRVAAAAKSCPGTRIEIGGHASAEGSPELNQQLSVRRAQAALAYLVRAGIDADRLHPVGHGASQPLVANDTGENMAKNRRIELTVITR